MRALGGRELRPTGERALLVQPDAAALEKAVRSRARREHADVLDGPLDDLVGIEARVKGAPVAAAGVQRNGPVLAEIGFDGVEDLDAKETVAGPKEPAVVRPALVASDGLALQRRKRIIRRERRNIVVEKTEGGRPRWLDQPPPNPVERRAVRAARASGPPRVAREAQIRDALG